MEWYIGNVKIKNQIGLAPMAGVSNPSYMKICEEMGTGFAISELISSEAIVRGNKKTFDMLNGFDTLSFPVGIQLFGSNPDTISNAAKIIYDKFKPSFIDINMGCPVPKVAVRAGSGSALLKDPDKVYEIVNKTVSSVSCPVTVKIRSGWDKEHINAVDIAKVCERAGASLITIHARTRSQGYSGKADWDIIKAVKKCVNIPVCGNGDVRSPEDAKKMLSYTSCDAVMIGRALLGNPWLIRNCISYLEGKSYIIPSNVDKIEMAKKHLDYLLKFKSEKEATLEIRSHIAWYLKGMPKSLDVKNKIFQTTNYRDILNILNEYEEEFK